MGRMKINVGVFFGGSSVEHEISVISALQAINALSKEKYNILPVYISKRSELYTGEALLEIDGFSDLEQLLASCTKIALARNGEDVLAYRVPPKRFGSNEQFKIDVAFPIVHGTNCEDGTIQGYLELLGIPYVGSDVLASALGMDKIATKNMLKENNIPVLDYLTFQDRDWLRDGENILNEIEETFSYPVIIKPANLGSSVGIKKAACRNELEMAIDLALSFAHKILVEKAVTNLKEVNCSVIGDYAGSAVSACEEPIGSDEILSYQDKYLNKSSSSKGMSSLKRKLPADISREKENEIRELAARVFKVLGCSGVVRIDFLLDLDQDNIVYVNEINTIPGSLSFYLWEAAGKPFAELLDELIRLAFKREREKQNIMYTYDINILSLKGNKSGKS